MTELAADPSVFAQAVMGAVPQTLNELSQYRPEAAAVQTTPAAPHKQGALFNIPPLVCAQLGAATHRQKSELKVHDLVEVDSVLYFSLLPYQ